jgi:hypothetical protein
MTVVGQRPPAVSALPSLWTENGRQNAPRKKAPRTFQGIGRFLGTSGNWIKESAITPKGTFETDGRGKSSVLPAVLAWRSVHPGIAPAMSAFRQASAIYPSIWEIFHAMAGIDRCGEKATVAKTPQRALQKNNSGIRNKVSATITVGREWVSSVVRQNILFPLPDLVCAAGKIRLEDRAKPATSATAPARN